MCLSQKMLEIDVLLDEEIVEELRTRARAAILSFNKR